MRLLYKLATDALDILEYRIYERVAVGTHASDIQARNDTHNEKLFVLKRRAKPTLNQHLPFDPTTETLLRVQSTRKCVVPMS